MNQVVNIYICFISPNNYFHFYTVNHLCQTPKQTVAQMILSYLPIDSLIWGYNSFLLSVFYIWES